MSLLRLESVTKHYRSDNQDIVALDNVSLAVEAGEFISVVGRSGCGKSTLLNLSGAMDFPTSGAVHINGVSTSGLADTQLTEIRRRQVGFVFQFFQLLPTLSAIENVELPLLLCGQTSNRRQALEKLRWVEMGELADRLPHQISGGQMQRVAIARALVHSPKLLLADEPIGNLDSASADIVIKLLRRTADEWGTAVVMATHSLEAAGVTDRIVQLRDGRVEEIRPA
ncbi:MAG: ABC transporter ATP-binding protein [Bryobacterales bacterium]|nr:ABC transporter ATP-binding protein [Bryobacterales bacterium]MDE0293862.1 ABC transporter ATP-binding protein [Bryobacterales bacterium]